MSSADNAALLNALEVSYRESVAYIRSLDERPVAALANVDTLRQRLDLTLSEEGMDPAEVLRELPAQVEGGLHSIASGRFFGWVNGGALPAALGADWLTSVWDQNASLHAVAPAASVVEEVVGTWLKQLLRLPSAASFALVTGCQMAHTTCLAAARHALLARRGWDVEEQGMSGAPRLRILTSSEAHGSAIRAIRLLGLGEANIERLACAPDGTLAPEALERALRADAERPTIVLLQAGDLNLGAFDPFEELVPLAHSFGAWVHVDGAFGLWAGASPRFRHLLAGAQHADSWATDGHKWLNVPYDCGYAFVADPEAHRSAFQHRAPYIEPGTARDAIDWTPEWSRRSRGFSTYAALRQMGTVGVAALIERTCAHAHALVTRIGALDGAEMLAEPQINQGLVRFLDPRPEATEADHARFTDGVTAAILSSGDALFSNTVWRGQRAMRVSVCNWQTSTDDVDKVVQTVGRILKELRSSRAAEVTSLA